MIYLSDLGQFHHDGPAIVTIGKFDGLHRGHQELMRRTIDMTGTASDPKTASVAVILDTSEKGLLTREERIGMLASEGFDYLIELPLDKEIRNLSAEAFVRDIIKKRLKAEGVVIGQDFRFGFGRAGDAAFMTESGERYDFTAVTVPDVTDEGIRISSSAIRVSLTEGQIERVNRYLGYPYFVSGEVVHGNHIGHTIDVPTANLVPQDDKLLPPNGVYVSATSVGGNTYKSMTNIGFKPTVKGSFLGIETHLFDFCDDLYGQEIKVELRHFSRPETTFDSLESLKERLRLDKAETLAWYEAES